MPRARTWTNQPGTAAAPQDQGSGCSFNFLLPPLFVILISTLLATAAWKTNPIAKPSFMPSIISMIFTPEIQYWSDSISRWSTAHDLDPDLVATVMQIESCGNPDATSTAGAKGLFQVMPFHFTIFDHPYNPDTNAERGLAYLVRSLNTAQGDARLALAGYNGGIGVIKQGEWTWSTQTRRYVQYGLPIYNDAHLGVSSSSALSEWYTNYGAGLCRKAHERLGLP